MSHVPQAGDWVARPGLEDEGPLLVTSVDGTGLFRARHWLTREGRWASPTQLGLYPVESSFGWMLVDPPVGLPDQCRAAFGKVDPFFCDLPLNHIGPHSTTGSDYHLVWNRP